jgi:hypothetical protein
MVASRPDPGSPEGRCRQEAERAALVAFSPPGRPIRTRPGHSRADSKSGADMRTCGTLVHKSVVPEILT